MKTRFITKHASFASRLVLLAGVLLIASSTLYAAPAQIWHKKGDVRVWLTLALGGWGTTGKEYVQFIYVPNTVVKEQKDGSLFIHDCDNTATVVIGIEGTDEILYTGTGSVVLQGLWTPDGQPSEDRTNWELKATLTDAEGNAWEYYWHVVVRDGKVNETFRFEPIN